MISQTRIVAKRWKQFQAGDLAAKPKLPSFTVLVWCSDELAVHSCPLLRLQTQNVTKLASALFCCCSLLLNNNMATNLQRFTSSYDLRQLMPFSACDCWPQTTLTGDAAIQWLSGVASPNFLQGPKNLEGPKFLILGEQQYMFGDTACHSEKWLLFLKIWGAWPPKRRCFILCEKKHEWICSSASILLKNPL